jgi:hypothetical protein
VTTLLGHTRRVWSVDFSPVGDALVSSGDDGTALIWDLGPLLARIAAGPGDADDADGGIAGVNAARQRASLVGMDSGWVAATPDGRYKGEGDSASEVWHVVGNCRFPLDGLSRYLPQVRRIGLDEQLDTEEG